MHIGAAGPAEAGLLRLSQGILLGHNIHGISLAFHLIDKVPHLGLVVRGAGVLAVLDFPFDLRGQPVHCPTETLNTMVLQEHRDVSQWLGAAVVGHVVMHMHLDESAGVLG